MMSWDIPLASTAELQFEMVSSHAFRCLVADEPKYASPCEVRHYELLRRELWNRGVHSLLPLPPVSPLYPPPDVPVFLQPFVGGRIGVPIEVQT